MNIALLAIDKEISVTGLGDGFPNFSKAAAEVVQQSVEMLARSPRSAPWGAYLAIGDHGEIVGTCAFKSGLRSDRSVEIAYMTFAPYEGMGVASAMAAALLELAKANGARLVSAHTLPEENASVHVLKRNGFNFVRDVIDPEDGPVWRWERRLKTA